MDSIARESLLYDFYGALLTDKKRRVMELYHEDDMSLAEIADEMGITRAAVHDSLKSAEAKLEKYEEKLGLLTKYENKAELAARAAKIITESQQKSPNTHSGNNHDNTDNGDSVLIDDASKKELLDIVEKLSEIR